MIVSIVLSLPSESLPIFFSFSSLTIIYESESLVTFFVLKPHGSRNLTGLVNKTWTVQILRFSKYLHRSY